MADDKMAKSKAALLVSLVISAIAAVVSVEATSAQNWVSWYRRSSEKPDLE